MGFGTGTKVGLAKGSVWGTAVTLGSGHRFPFVSCGTKPVPGVIENEDLNESGVQESPFLGNTIVEGPLVHHGDFRQPQHLLLAALFMGVAGVPATVEVGAYLHELHYQADNEGLFATMGVDFSDDAYGYASVKSENRVIEIEAAGRLIETNQILGRTVNKAIDMSAVDYTTDPVDGGTLRILQRMLTVRITSQGDGAFDAADIQPVVSATITMDRTATRQHVAAGALEEPVRAGWAPVTVQLTFARATAALLALLADAFDAGTALKMDMVLDFGAVIGATGTNYERAFYFPKLKVRDDVREITGPGPNPFSVTLSAHHVTTAPTGFTADYTQPVVETWQNEISTDPFA